MTKISRDKWERLLNGMSHAVFEVTWSAFPWMKQIWIKNSAGRAHFIVQVAEAVAKEEDEFCRQDAQTLVEAVRNIDPTLFPAGYTLRYSRRRVPRGMGYRTLMSDRLFREIAKKKAPWRLERGR